MTKTIRSGVRCTALLALGLFPVLALGQLDVTRTLFTPVVVSETQAEPVRFEVTVSGNPPSLVFEYDGVDRPMFNDGTHGDQVAGDDTWTIMFTPSEILTKNTPSSMFRPFIGYAKVAGLGNFNVFAEIWTSAIPLRAIRPVNGGGQETNYVVNYTATRAELINFDREAWARRFYQTHPDNFDFINFVLIPGRRGNRFHANVSNAVQGIGLSHFDTTAIHGSAGRLKGINTFPISYYYDGGEKAFSHETGHQWINYLPNASLSSGRPHWPKGNVASNVMGYSLAGGVGGDYLFTFSPNGSGGWVAGPTNALIGSTFNSMELYMMGLVPSEEVGDFFVLKDQTQNVSVGQTLQPSEITPVSVQQIVGANGPRIPDSTHSQKNFRVATILVSEQPLDAHAMAFYDYFARRTEAREPLPFSTGFSTGMCNPWYLATGGRSVMRSALRDTTPFDFDGDGRADIAIYRPQASAEWWMLNSLDGSASGLAFGTTGDIAVPADYTGDGKTDVAVWRPSNGSWYVLRSEDLTFYGYPFGSTTDIPAPADFDGDGKADAAVYRPAEGAWYALGSQAGFSSTYFGTAEDRPVPGDYDGDSKADIAVFRSSSGAWYIQGSTSGFSGVNFGLGTDLAVPGDYDGDGKTDVAVYRPSSGTWYLWGSTRGFYGYPFGLATDLPAPGDYDGDGKTDAAVFRPSNGAWYILASTAGFSGTVFGLGTDQPIENAFVR